MKLRLWRRWLPCPLPSWQDVRIGEEYFAPLHLGGVAFLCATYRTPKRPRTFARSRAFGELTLSPSKGSLSRALGYSHLT